MDRLCGETLQSPTTKVMVMYSDLVKSAFRQGKDPGHSSEDLSNLEQDISDFKNFSQSLYGPYQTSEMRSVKFHLLDHLVDDVKRMCSLKSMDAGLHESSHREVKSCYRSTSKRYATAMSETVSAITFRQRLKRHLSSEHRLPAEDSTRISLQLTGKGGRIKLSMPTSTKCESVAGGSATLVRKGVKVSFRDMENLFDGRSGIAGTRARNKIQQNRRLDLDLSNFPLPLQNLISEVGVHGIQQLCNSLRERACLETHSACEKNSILQSLKLEIVQSGFVSSVDIPSSSNYEPDAAGGERTSVQDTGRRTIHRFVSSHSFYGARRQDAVVPEAAPAASDAPRPWNSQIELFYAKPLLLFHATALSGPFSSASRGEKELMFLQHFDVCPLEDPIDKVLGCVKLKWSRLKKSDDDFDELSIPWRDVQPIAALRGRIQVIRGDVGLEKTKSYQRKRRWTDHWFYVNRFRHESRDISYYEQDRES